MATNQVDVLHACQPIGDTLIRRPGDFILAGLDPRHIDRNIAVHGNAEICRLTSQMCNPGTAHERFRRYAADVDASPADQLAFDDGSLLPFRIQTTRECGAGLTGTNNDCVVFIRHSGLPGSNL